MFDKDEGPHDWEMKDEEPPEKLQKKWEREETRGPQGVVCPSCKKETPDENRACIFCGTDLSGALKVSPTPWYSKTAILVISFLTVGPFALPLVWLHPVYSRRKKILVTGIVLALTCILVAAFVHAVKTILDYYKQAGIF